MKKIFLLLAVGIALLGTGMLTAKTSGTEATPSAAGSDSVTIRLRTVDATGKVHPFNRFAVVFYSQGKKVMNDNLGLQKDGYTGVVQDGEYSIIKMVLPEVVDSASVNAETWTEVNRDGIKELFPDYRWKSKGWKLITPDWNAVKASGVLTIDDFIVYRIPEDEFNKINADYNGLPYGYND